MFVYPYKIVSNTFCKFIGIVVNPQSPQKNLYMLLRQWCEIFFRCVLNEFYLAGSMLHIQGVKASLRFREVDFFSNGINWVSHFKHLVFVPKVCLFSSGAFNAFFRLKFSFKLNVVGWMNFLLLFVLPFPIYFLFFHLSFIFFEPKHSIELVLIQLFLLSEFYTIFGDMFNDLSRDPSSTSFDISMRKRISNFTSRMLWFSLGITLFTSFYTNLLNAAIWLNGSKWHFFAVNQIRPTNNLPFAVT